MSGLTGKTFVQPAIVGYRQLSQAEVDLMNEGKALAEQVGAFISRLGTHRQSGASEETDKRFEPSLDHRWIAIGKTQLQQGWMAVIRGIAQPSSF